MVAKQRGRDGKVHSGDRGRSRSGEERVWVKGCLINLKGEQRSLQNANETIRLIAAVDRSGTMEGLTGLLGKQAEV